MVPTVRTYRRRRRRSRRRSAHTRRRRRDRGLPELRAFIDKGLDAFPEVTVRQVAGKPPTLRLRQVASGGKGKGKGGKSAAAAADGSDGAKEDVRLDSWKQDHIRDFLKRKLKAHHATATSA